MKTGLLIECNKNNFFKNHKENDAGRLLADLFLLLKKALCEVLYKLDISFLEKGLGIVSPPHLCMIFHKKVSYVIFY